MGLPGYYTRRRIGPLADIHDIEKIARDVYRTLGSGFSEDVYDRAMQVGLKLARSETVYADSPALTACTNCCASILSASFFSTSRSLTFLLVEKLPGLRK